MFRDSDEQTSSLFTEYLLSPEMTLTNNWTVMTSIVLVVQILYVQSRDTNTDY